MLSELAIEGEDYWEEIDEERCIFALGGNSTESEYRDADYIEQINKVSKSGVGTNSSKKHCPMGRLKRCAGSAKF